jgi:hypothetical protein
MSAEEILEIKCPKCGKLHKYNLEVKRSVFLENITIRSNNDAPIPRSFKRLFSCPLKENDFEAIIMLIETRHTKIESVEIKGLVAENQDGNIET